VEERESGGPFHGLFDFCERVDLGVVNKRALEGLVKSGAFDSTGASRRGMLHVLAQAMACGQKIQNDEAQGQGSIFDLMDSGSQAPAAGRRTNGSSLPPVAIPEEDFSKQELLALEKETLGLYLSSHPLRDLRPYIRMEAETLIHELAELPDGAITTIVGMVGSVKRITTKKSGENMAFVILEGLEGSVEMPCFPGIYNDNRALLTEDQLVKVKGRVDHKDENETKFIPLAVEPFVPVTGQEPVCLLLDGQKMPRRILEDLKTIISHFPGPCPVEVQVVTPREKQRLRFGKDFRVDPQTSLFAELKVLLGEAAVSRGLQA